MPMSSQEGKSWIRARVDELAQQYGPLEVVDVGPGVGTYAKLLAGPGVAHITGIEVFEPYVETYRLHEYYDRIVLGDIRTTPVPACDVVVLGDVVEHMSEAEAVDVWAAATRAARHAVYLSIPVVHYPQGEIEGNPHEVHVVEDWDHEAVLARFEGIGAFETGREVGVYERRMDSTGD
ncbi:class I SAM-dependent methyltransferase [Jatrophihabitans sp. YIM 134969]